MEASLAHRRAVAVSFPFNGWNSWTDDDIATAVKVGPCPLLPSDWSVLMHDEVC